MKAAAVALREIVVRIANGVGLEGLFLLIGTISLAIGSYYIAFYGPWLVVGVMGILAGLALAVPGRR